MKSSIILLVWFFIIGKAIAQNADFYGNKIDKSICQTQSDSINNTDAVDALNKVCNAADIPNNFFLLPCSQIETCFALYKDGISYIVYDPKFFKRIQTYGFTEKKLPGGVDWSALTMLAHELGHHLCQHTTNPVLASKYTPVQLELQADEFAGSIMYKLGATLAQAQKAMYSEGTTEKETLTHPARKDRLAAIEKGYDKYAKKPANKSVVNTVTTTPASDGKVTFVIPKFVVLASNVKYNLAEQMKQILVSNLQNDGTYNIVASSFDIQNYRNDPAVAYGGESAIKKANYVLLGKIMSYEEKQKGFGLGKSKVSLGKTLIYKFSFEIINAKTNELTLTKDWELKVNSGKIGVENNTTKHNSSVTLDPDVINAYEKQLKDIIKSITEQKSKIVIN